MSNTIYGYARVSTARQKLDRQISNIKAAYPSAVIVTEKYTGTTTDRPELSKLLRIVKSGDTIVFDSVSRMSRTADEGYQLYMNLYQQGINLEFLKEPMINTDVFRQTAQLAMTGTDVDCVLDGINRYLMLLAEKQIRIAFDQSEKEVDDLHHRISEGLRQTQIRGVHVGRVKGQTYETAKARETKRKIRKLSRDFDGNMSDKEILTDYLNISRRTYYAYKAEIRKAKNP